MAEPILKLTRGIPKTDREWMDVFRNLTKFFRVSGNELIIGGDIVLPEQSVGTDEIEDDAVTDIKLRQSQGNSVIGRSIASAGTPTDIQASGNGQFLRQAGGVVGFGLIADGDIPAGIARDTEVASSISTAISNHESAVDPHTQYLTQTEGDARYRELTDVVTYAELTGKPAALALLLSGTGTPEGTLVAGVGSLFLRTDGGASTTLYIKESGTGNTGWVAK